MADPTRDRIQKLKASIAAQSEFIDTSLTRAADEERDLNDVELANLDEARSTVQSLTDELERLVSFHNAVAGADKLAPVERGAIRTQPRAETGAVTVDSLGARFSESDQLRSYRAGTSGSLEVDDIIPSEFAMQRAALTVGEAQAPWPTLIASTGVQSAPVTDKQRPLLQVISRAPTTLASVPVLRVGSDESGAAIVAEGADKPEVTWTQTIESIPVETIAGYKKASRQILDDVAMVRNLIDTKLTRSILNVLEGEVVTALTDQITAGNTTTGVADEPLLNVIRKAVGELEGRSHIANAIMLNPADYADLDLSVLGSTLLGPVVGSQFWGLRVVSNPNIATGTAYVGDFAEAVTLYERTGMNLFVTDSDISGSGAQATSDFRRNIITFLAEIRAVPVVMDASAVEAAVLFGES